MTKMRPGDPGERWLSAWIIRPTVWLAFQFSREARFIRSVNRASDQTPAPERR